MTTWEVILQGSARADLPAWAESPLYSKHLLGLESSLTGWVWSNPGSAEGCAPLAALIVVP